MKIALIAAQSENGVIGRGMEIPWKVKGEQAMFKAITLGGSLIMGRRTFDAIGRPLPGRTTIVISRNRNLIIDGCQTAGSLKQALGLASGPIFIAGGGQIYQQAMPLASAIHLTTIHTVVEGDVYFPDLPEDFELKEETKFSSNIDYTYRHFERPER